MKVKSQKLAGKKIALCVTGSAAAIQSPRLARELLRHGAEVTSYMSRAAANIIHPHTMEFATGREVITKLTGKTEHLMGWDLVVVAPATANSLAKMAHGMGDTPVTALLLSSDNVLIAPAMNQSMYENPLVKANIEKLKELGHAFVEPLLEEGEAKMAPIEEITEEAIALLHPKDLSGLQFLVTAGATQEHIDPIRVITNNSSGKMGLSVAKEAYFRGATVTLVLGRSSISPPRYLRVLRVETVRDMLEAVVKEISSADVFISVGAVSDFRVAGSPHKLDSRKTHRITLVPTPKILEQVKKAKCVKVGFKALYNASEDELIASASRLMKEHALDLVVANDLSTGILGSDEAEVHIFSGKDIRRVSMMSKTEVASIILDAIKECISKDAG